MLRALRPGGRQLMRSLAAATTRFEPSPIATIISCKTTIWTNNTRCYGQGFRTTMLGVKPDGPPKQMKFAEVEERVLKAIKLFDRLPTDKELTMDSHFINDLGLDSLDHVEIIMAIEDEFGFEIPDGDAERLMTPKDIFQYICDREDVYE